MNSQNFFHFFENFFAKVACGFLSNNSLPERDCKGRHYFDKTNFFSFFFKKNSKKARIIVIHLLQDMADDDITQEGRLVADGEPLAVLVDQRDFFLIEKHGFTIPPDQLGVLLSPIIRLEIVPLRFLLPSHTYIYNSRYSIGSPVALHQVACRRE